MRRWCAVLAACGVLALSGARGVAARQAAPDDGVVRLLLRLQQVMQTGKPEAYLDLVGVYADRDLAATASRTLIAPGITRAVVRERDRTALEGTLPGDGFRLMAEAFIEYGDRARVATWRFDVRRTAPGDGDDAWAIVGQQQLSSIDGLYRLSLNTTRQYRARDLIVRAEDIEFRMADGRVFVSETDGGPTAVVLLPTSGASVAFRPTPETEREQVKLYAGSDTVATDFDELFLRVNPGDFSTLFPPSAVHLEAVDAGAARRAEAVFRAEVGKSFSLDMGDLSREQWSLSPGNGDILAEIRTKRFHTLTYVRSSGEPEDISLFERRRRRNIAAYGSRDSVQRHGRFFDEDVTSAYDITDYLVEASFDPERQFIEGRTRLRLRPREGSLNTLTLKLADSLTVHSVFSPDFGPLLSLRIRNQNSVVVNLPGVVTRGAELTLTVAYSGPIAPSQAEQEGIAPEPQQGRDPFMYDALGLPGEPSWLYTTRTFWYPQSPVSDYAPALMRLTVPEGFSVVASGELLPGSPVVVPPREGERFTRRLFVFTAPQPLRYLSCLISRFVRVDARPVPLQDLLTVPGSDGAPASVRPARPGVFYNELAATTVSNPRLQSRGRRMAQTAQDVARFYTGLVGDCPYPSLTVAVIEKDLPGGHSPAYLSVLHQPMPQANFTWSNDPAAFPNYPDFFVAHEIAHQWWGQAIGWKSYHEQWISEGFAQYFAALYARQTLGEAAFNDVLRRMARFGKDQSSQGPISLGYRLGHIRGDSRVFRSLVYNKAAIVLHSLRLLVGDDVFLRGMRRFYFDSRFRKAGTADVQLAFERESGRDLSAFFENWIHSSGVPVVKCSWTRDERGSEPALVVRVEQVGRVFELPLPITLVFADQTTQDVVIPVTARSVEQRIPLKGSLRDVLVNPAGTVIVDVYGGSRQ